MSNVVLPKGHRHTRSTVLPSSSYNPQVSQDTQQINAQSYALNSKPDMNYSPQPSTPPRTPRRNEHTQAPSHKAPSSVLETGSKRKPRNQRPKNVNTSPAIMRNSRNSPPLTGAQSAGLPSSAKPISTPTTTAFAGPTFHASPAPSALPIPSFYSKSVPESPGIRNLKNMKDISMSPKPAPASNAEAYREESPLDFIFKADREEKERARSASSTQAATAPTGPFHPPSMSPLPKQTPPTSTSQSNARRAANRVSSSGIFAMELDGESSPGAPLGPAFSTPYSERINAARPKGSERQNSNSEALKAFLFSGQQLPSPAFTTPGDDGHSSPFAPASGDIYRNSPPMGGPRNIGLTPRTQSYGASGRSSGLRQEVTPTRTPIATPERVSNFANSPTPVQRYGSFSDAKGLTGKYNPQVTCPAQASPYAVTGGPRSVDLQGMENDLRKILKLGPAISSGPVNGNLPAATVSVPNYVGGRQAPMNGMHNGVMGS